MSPQAPVQHSPMRRRKVSIEIYFVLYLSAIILLLGTTPARHSSREDQLEEVIRHLLVSDFKVKVEKAALLYSFIPAGVTLDTSGAVLRRDSLNVISARGTFERVEFKVVSIEDSINGRAIPLERARLLKTTERSAIFQWNPSTNDGNGVYRVTVAGIATPLPPTSLPAELRDRVAEILRRKGTVTDSVTFTINVYAVVNQAMLRRITQAPPTGSLIDTSNIAALRGPIDTMFVPSGAGSPFSGQGFEFSVGNTEVPVTPGMSWRNKITLAGGASTADLDLQVTEGNAQIIGKAASLIELGGTAPASGSQRITVTGTRRSDGRKVFASFTIRTVGAAPPSIPSTMIVGEAYPLDFRSNGLPAERIAVEVIENGKLIVGRDEGRSIFKYQPGTPGNIRFIRYLDNQRLDETLVDAVPLMRPQTNQPQAERGASEAVVTTIAYGTLSGQPNRVSLKIKSGNAEEPEQIDERRDDQTKQTIQRWRVRRKDRSKSFEFVAYSIDQRGSKTGKSNEVSFAVP